MLAFHAHHTHSVSFLCSIPMFCHFFDHTKIFFFLLLQIPKMISSWCGKSLFITNKLTPWRRAPPEKLTGLQLVKKFATFYGIGKFNTTFTSTCPCPEPDQSSQCPPSHFFKISFGIIISSNARSLNHMSLYHCLCHAK
jgi:hypothetical protein